MDQPQNIIETEWKILIPENSPVTSEEENIATHWDLSLTPMLIGLPVVIITFPLRVIPGSPLTEVGALSS